MKTKNILPVILAFVLLLLTLMAPNITGSGAVRALGDIDNDGKTSASDLLLMKKHILKISVLKGDDYNYADINQDGDVDVEDLLLLKKHCLKLIDIFIEYN